MQSTYQVQPVRLSFVTGLNCTVSSCGIFASNPFRPSISPPCYQTLFFGMGHVSVMDGSNVCPAQGTGMITANDGGSTTTARQKTTDSLGL